MLSQFIAFLETAANAQAAAPAAGGQPTLLENMMPILIMLPVMYFLLIRPQSKKFKEQSSFIGELKRGDKVVTESGIYGVIVGLNDSFATLEISDGVSIKVLKSKIDAGFSRNQGEKK